MNLWITKISQTRFSKTDRSNFSQIISDKFSHKFEVFEHKTPDIHFLSFSKNQTKYKKYIHSRNEQEVFSYSGIIIDTKESVIDYRNAEVLANNNVDTNDLTNHLCGQFALVSIKNNEFRCVVDNLGLYKVFYYSDAQKNIYISNHLSFIQGVKKSKRNFDFLINFIANGGTFGHETMEKDVLTLPESGELRWSPGSGLTIKRYQEFSELFTPPPGDPIETTGRQLQQIATYLTKYHDVLIPLSGGYDSRTILNMFWGRYSNNLTAYSYLDHPYDFKTAKKLARKYGVNHIEIMPGEIPSVNELHQFSLERYPFVCYSSVFKYVFYETSQKKLYNTEKVELWGNGGAIDMGVAGFGDMDNLSPKKSIEKLASKKVNRTILTQDAYKHFHTRVTDYYSEKYSPLFDQVKNFNLPTAHYMFERFASYQGHKYSDSYSDGSKVHYFPYGNKYFVQLTLSSDTKELMRRKKGGLHHQLTDFLTDKKSPRVPYAKSLHWNATKSDKAAYYLKRDYVDRLFKKLNLTKDKYSNQVRNSFFDKNEEHFIDVVHSYSNSKLWDFIDYNHVKNSLENPKNRKMNMKLLFRIIPLLKEGL